MKLLLSALLFISCLKCLAQDTIFFKNSEKIPVILSEVNPDNVKYKRFDNQTGPTYTVLKNEINFVIYSNGKKESFDKTVTNNNTSVSSSQDSTINRRTAAATDTLIFKSGRKVPVKIKEITSNDVKYIMANNPDGPSYTTSKAEIKEVVFSTGLKQSFAGSTAANTNYNQINNSYSSMTAKGTADAKRYYKHNGGSIGVGIATGIFPIAGLIPAVACSAFPPREKNLGYPDDGLWSNPTYKTSYMREASRMKRKKIWTTFGVVTVGWIALAIITSN